MPDRSFLDWPFFTADHRKLAADVEAWAARELSSYSEPENLDRYCRHLVQKMGEAGWLRYSVPTAFGGVNDRLDVRSLCIIRETLARFSGVADFSFALQGLGSAPISFHGSPELQQKYLPAIAAGKAIAAFAISETEAGSDLAAMRTVATKSGSGYIIDGEKTWISNAGIADHYVVFARLPEVGEKKFLAAVVAADNPAMKVTKRIEVLAPHPLGTVRFSNCKVEAGEVLGEPGGGLRIALATLDIFRATVGAAAVGLARRALEECITHTKNRRAFGQPLAEFQLTQSRIADMATRTDASALVVYRAAWQRDAGAARVTREAAMAKLYATEAAQQTIDDALQLFGGRGVVRGEVPERLYREIRALRIYEGTSEIQKLVIARELLRSESEHVRSSHAD